MFLRFFCARCYTGGVVCVTLVRVTRKYPKGLSSPIPSFRLHPLRSPSPVKRGVWDDALVSRGEQFRSPNRFADCIPLIRSRSDGERPRLSRSIVRLFRAAARIYERGSDNSGYFAASSATFAKLLSNSRKGERERKTIHYYFQRFQLARLAPPRFFKSARAQLRVKPRGQMRR